MQAKQLMLAAVASAILFLTAPAADAEMKVAVVNVAQALLQSEAGKRGIAEIRTELEEEKAARDAVQEEATGLLEKLKKDTELMSDQEFAQLLANIQAKNSEFAQRNRNYQLALEEREQRLVASLRDQLQKAIEQVVLDEDLDIVIPRTAVVWAGELYDVTLKVTEKMNEQEAE